MRVLLIDDHPLILEFMPAVIKRAIDDAEILIEATLEGGIERARGTEGIGLVLLDLGLPGCIGIESLQRFFKEAPEIPTLVISAKEDGATIRAVIANGAKGYLPKTLPVPLMESTGTASTLLCSSRRRLTSAYMPGTSK